MPYVHYKVDRVPGLCLVRWALFMHGWFMRTRGAKKKKFKASSVSLRCLVALKICIKFTKTILDLVVFFCMHECVTAKAWSHMKKYVVKPPTSNEGQIAFGLFVHSSSPLFVTLFFSARYLVKYLSQVLETWWAYWGWKVDQLINFWEKNGLIL